jgi:hypothetical protein
VVNKAYEGGRTVVDMIKDGGVATGDEHDRGRAGGGGQRSMRAVALADKIPYFTTLAASHAAAQAMKAAREGELGSTEGRVASRSEQDAECRVLCRCRLTRGRCVSVGLVECELDRVL